MIRPSLLVFFKTSCPTCRLEWPYLVRLAERCSSALSVIAYSQDDPPATAAFLDELGGSGPVEVRYDPEPDFPLSSWASVETVPHHVLLDEGFGAEVLPEGPASNPPGGAQRTWFGWRRRELEDLARDLSERYGPFPLPLIPDDDPVPALRPG